MVADPSGALADALVLLDPAHGLVIPLDDPRFAATESGRRSAEIEAWTVAKIKRIGADAVKLLVWYRPDQDAASRAHQEDLVQRTGAACARYDIPFLLELRVYPFPGAAAAGVDDAVAPRERADLVLASVERFAGADFGVDLFALESPLPAAEVPAPEGAGHAVDTCRALFDELGRRAGRPWVVRSAGATAPAFRHIVAHACHAGASGHLAGRAVWWDGFEAFPDLALMHQALATGASDTMRELDALADRHARPWTDWYGEPLPAGWDSPCFPRDYPSF